MGFACEECGHSAEDAYGWIANVIEDDVECGADPYVVFYCPTCAEREFDFVSHRRPDGEFLRDGR